MKTLSVKSFSTPCGPVTVVASAEGLVRVILLGVASAKSIRTAPGGKSPNAFIICHPERSEGSRRAFRCGCSLRPSTSIRASAPSPARHSLGEGGSALRTGKRRAPAAAKAMAARARREILEYLRGRRRAFAVPLDLAAVPPFSRRILLAARRIPYGATVTYGQLARHALSPRAARAVGQAMARNPVPLLVPCHRVVASGGLGGFSGGLVLKRRLLALEGARRSRSRPKPG